MIIESAAHVHCDCLKNAVWTCSACFILIDNLKVDVVNIVFDNCLDYKILALRVAKVHDERASC